MDEAATGMWGDRSAPARAEAEEPRTLDASLEGVTAAFTENRVKLFSLVYHLVGSVSDTEDVLQETWLIWASAARRRKIDNASAYLMRIAANEGLSKLRRARREREHYPGPWLPEPLVTEFDAGESTLRAESVSMAMMVVLETLTPLERAVFVLHEAFGYRHAEIAAILGRTTVAVRQVTHRARKHVQARRPRYAPDRDIRRVATERFLSAALGGDLNTLMEVLAPEVAMWTDGGGKVHAARRVIEGRDKVVRLISAESGKRPRHLAGRALEVNGGPAALILHDGAVYGVVTVDLNPGGRIRGIYQVVNPDKLTRLIGWDRPRTAGGRPPGR